MNVYIKPQTIMNDIGYVAQKTFEYSPVILPAALVVVGVLVVVPFP